MTINHCMLVKDDLVAVRRVFGVMHQEKQPGKVALLKSMGVRHRAFRIVGLHLGLVDGRLWTFAEIGRHYRVSGQAASKAYYLALEKICAWVRAGVRA